MAVSHVCITSWDKKTSVLEKDREILAELFKQNWSLIFSVQARSPKQFLGAFSRQIFHFHWFNWDLNMHWSLGFSRTWWLNLLSLTRRSKPCIGHGPQGAHRQPMGSIILGSGKRECPVRLGLDNPGSQWNAGPAFLSSPLLNWELKCTLGQEQPRWHQVPECRRGDLGTSCHLHSPGVRFGQLLQGLTDSNDKRIAGGHPHLHREPQPSFLHSKPPSFHGNADSSQEYTKVSKHPRF